MFTLILDETLKELTVHGSKAFPFEIYLGGATMFEVGHLDWHWHDFFEINLLTSGTLHYFIEDKKYFLRPGDAIFINAGRLHRGYSDDPPRQSSNTIVFGSELFCGDLSSQWYSAMIENFIHSDINGFVLTSDIPWMKDVLSELALLYEAYDQNTPAVPLIIKGHMCRIFADILNHITFDSKPADIETEKKKRIRTLLSYISQNYMNPVTLSELAGLVGLSASECSRFFSSQMKLTPFEYLNRYRIERSCELLVMTDFSISEISMRVGFNSFSYYSKRFREIMQCSPLEYRRKIRDAIAHGCH